MSPLPQAASDGDLRKVRALLAAGEPVDAPGEKGATALMRAAELGHVDVVKALLAAGADARFTREHGIAVLHHAAAADSGEMVKLLLAAGADRDARTTGGFTPLLAALNSKSWKTAQALLDAGAGLSVSPLGKQALAYALQVDTEATFDDERPPLEPALAEVLVEQGASLDATYTNGWTLLHMAARTRNPQMIAFLRERGLQIDAATPKGVTPLMVVSDSVNIESLMKGLTLAASISGGGLGVDGRTVERRMRTTGAPSPMGMEFVKRLQSMRDGRRATIQALLAAGANPNARTPEGDTPLAEAAVAGDAGAVAALLAGGADPNVVRPKGYSPLMMAAANGYDDVVKALLAGGADPNLRNSIGETALMRGAIAGGDGATVAALLAAGADPNARNGEGQTPLIYALGGREEFLFDGKTPNPELKSVVEQLLAAGADPSVKDAKGATAESLAKAPNYRPALKLLQKKGKS